SGKVRRANGRPHSARHPRSFRARRARWRRRRRSIGSGSCVPTWRAPNCSSAVSRPSCCSAGASPSAPGACSRRPWRSRRPMRRSPCDGSPTWPTAGIPPTRAASGHSRSRVMPRWYRSRWRCEPGRKRLARARIRRGELDLADSVLLGDSSVAALALRGWVALYSGDMKGAQQMFRAAGPYAGDRRDATERSGVLALLQQLPGDRFPELGSALLLVARGDSARAVQSLRLAAGRLETAGGGGGGRADILLLAGRIAVRLDTVQQRTALTLFAEVAGAPGRGAAAPAAELEWARLLLRQQKPAEAIAHLEHLILAYPES